MLIPSSMKAKLLDTLLTVLGLLVTTSVWAQSPQLFHTAVAGQLTRFGVISEPNRSQIRVQPRHGVARFNSSGGSTGAIGPDVLEYTSTTGYLGKDTLEIEYWTLTPNTRVIRVQYIITVVNSWVKAANDFASTVTNQPVSIAVLANDTASFGSLAVSSLPIVTHGTAVIQGSNVVFTPSSGFVGNASFQYISCDIAGACDVATVVITVSDPTPTTDTLSLQVEKNKSQVVLLDPQNFVLTAGPQHGSISLGFPVRYTPYPGYTGPDSFEWTLQVGSETFIKHVSVQVLNTLPQNHYARDDQFFISKATVAYLDVLANDLQGPTLSGFNVITNPQNGTVSIQNRQVVYTPNPRFTGVDKFRYRVFPPGYSGPVEYATVSVLVSDQTPAALEFSLETPKNTPLVLEYPIPLTNYSFGVLTPLPTYGQATFLPNADTVIAGYSIVGQRLLVYNPDSNFTGQDLVRVNYCITTTGACVALNLRVTVKDIATPAGGWCIQDCVWPGDTDGNGKVEVADLLPIGRKHGMQGLTRTGGAGAWRGMPASNWLELDQSLDLKYVDANGDGIISASDTSVILTNLNRYHTAYPAPSAPLQPMPFVLSFPYDTIYAGEVYAIDIDLGTPNFYAYDVYGFTLGFNFNPRFVVQGTQELIYENDGWIGYGSAPLDLVHEPNFGSVVSAYTRTDGRSVTGYGRVGRFYFTGSEDILGFRPAPLRRSTDPAQNLTPSAEVVGVADFELIDGSVSVAGVTYSVPGSAVRVPVAVRPKGLALRDQDLVVYPNPARPGGQMRIHLNGAERMQSIRIISDLGVVVDRLSVESNDLLYQTGDLAAGVYTIEVEQDGQVVRQRVVIR